MITLEMTVNQLIDLDSRWMNELNNWNVDTCCGGNHSLAHAAREAGLEPEELLRRINETEQKWNA